MQISRDRRTRAEGEGGIVPRLLGVGLLALLAAVAGCAGNIDLKSSPNPSKVSAAARATAVISDSTSALAASEPLQALTASLDGPAAVALAPDGSVYIAEFNRSLVRRISPVGELTSFAGTGVATSPVRDGVPALTSGVRSPTDLAVDREGNVFIASSRPFLGGGSPGLLLRVDARTGLLTILAGNGNLSDDNVRASAASLSFPSGLAVDDTGNLYVAEPFQDRVRQIQRFDSPDPGARYMIRTVFSAASEPGKGLRFSLPVDVATDASGRLYVAEASGRVFRVAGGSASVIFTPAANSLVASTVAVFGNTLYLGSNSALGRLDLASLVFQLVAGGTPGFAGDELAATQARFAGVSDLAAGNGRVLLADFTNNRIRSVTSTAVATTADTVAGRLKLGPQLASVARLGTVRAGGLVADGAFSVYIADTGAIRRLRNVAAATAAPDLRVETVAGDGLGGATGDGGLATLARVGAATAVAVARQDAPPGVFKDDLFFCDPAANRVRVVRKSSGKIEAYAGTGVAGHDGDGGVATAAKLNRPEGIALDRAGNLFVADTRNQAVRKVNRFGIVSTLAATSSFIGFDESGTAPLATGLLAQPTVLAVSSSASSPAATRVLVIGSSVALLSLDSVGRASATTPVNNLSAGSVSVDDRDRLYLSQGFLSSVSVLRLDRFGTTSAKPTSVLTAGNVPAGFNGVTSIAIEPDGQRLWFSDGKRLAFRDLGTQ